MREGERGREGEREREGEMEIETEWLRAGDGGAGRVCGGAQGGESVVASWRGVRVTRASPAGVGGGGMVASGLFLAQF